MTTTTKKPKSKKPARKKPAAKNPKAKTEPADEKPQADPEPEEPAADAAPEPPKPKVSAPGGPEGDPRVKGPTPPPDRKVSGPAGEFGVPSAAPVWKKGEPGCRIKNLRNKAVDVSLDHETYCAEVGRCVCAERDVAREKLIERGSKAQAISYERIKLAKAIRIPPMGISEPLHEAAKQCADVTTKVMSRPQKLKILPV
jgi:hypothetical protein